MAESPGKFHIQDNTLVSRFFSEVPQDDQFESLRLRWSNILSDAAVTGHVVVIDVENPAREDLVHFGKHVAQQSSDHDISNLVFVLPAASLHLLNSEFPQEHILVTNEVSKAFQWISE